MILKIHTYLLNLYINNNIVLELHISKFLKTMKPEKKIEAQISFLESVKSKVVIDSDVHITDTDKINDQLKLSLKQSENYYHGKPLSVKEVQFEMQHSQVDMCLIWQNPALTIYSDNAEENYHTLLKANKYIHDTFQEYPQQFIPGGWIDPKVMLPAQCKKMIQVLIQEYGFPIIKMNPAQNEFMIDSDIVFEMVNEIYKYGAIPAFHFGSDTQYTPVEGLEKLLIYANEKPVIAIHMGGGGASYVESEKTYQKARELGLKYPNVKYVLSAKRDTHIESDLITYELAGTPFSNNLMCASDAPYGKMAWNFGGFRLLFESFLKRSSHPDSRIRNNPHLFSKESIQNYLGGNMANLAIYGYRSILSKL